MSSNFDVEGTEIKNDVLGNYHGMNGRIELGGRVIGLVTGVNWSVDPTVTSQYNIMGSNWAGPKAVSGLVVTGSFRQGLINSDLLKLIGGVEYNEDGEASYYMSSNSLEDPTKDPVSRAQDPTAKPVFPAEFDLVITNAKKGSSSHDDILAGSGDGGTMAWKIWGVKLTRHNINAEGSDFWMNDMTFIADYVTIIDNK